MSEHQEVKLLPFTVKEVHEKTSEIPYGVNLMKAPEIWEKGEKGKGVVVAILDTGIDTTHPDLKDRIIGGRNFTAEGNKNDFTDHNGHGTHVAGTIAGSENETGVVGVAPEASLLICKVLGANGSGSYKGITDAIKWATKWRGPNNERVRVMNMSLGGPYNDRQQHRAILEACAEGILVVVASGNEGDANEETLEYGYPALINECVTISACDSDKKLAYFSNNSRQVDFISAGVDVLSTYPTGQYAVLSGTSMATPHVTGAIALIINMGEKYFGRTLTESEIYALVAKCSCSLGYKPTSEGHGFIDLPALYKLCEEK
jgi:major intracellular serine protease